MNGELLKRLRKQKKISAQAMAALIGTHRDTVTRIENDESTDWQNVIKYVDALGDMEIRILPKL